MSKNKKICIVSSCGGHLTEIRMLLSIYSFYDYFYVLNDKALLASDMKDKTYFITHSERDIKFFKNLWEAFQIIRKERPDVLMSTGAGPIVPFSLVGRFLFGIKTIYIETFTSIEKPTLTGKIMYWLADFFYYQWPDLKKYFPKGEYIGTLL
ncbi:MAG: exopolysaccharide biosynthesis protein, glycosyltransferase [uncultured bacterium]|nr:MAG: exopolysaccharide biosynthesis protein, glycosyltransferase [uncultured bacterium]